MDSIKNKEELDMGVPAVVVAEVTKCGGQLVTRMVENITQFNIERMNLKATAIKGIRDMVTVYEGNNKIYIESSERTLEKILKAIPADANPDQAGKPTIINNYYGINIGKK